LHHACNETIAPRWNRFRVARRNKGDGWRPTQPEREETGVAGQVDKWIGFHRVGETSCSAVESEGQSIRSQLVEESMPIPFECSECKAVFEVDDDLAGKTIRCRDCHGFGRVEVPRKKLPPKTTPATKPQETLAHPGPDTLPFRHRSPWLIAVAVALQVCTILVWSICIVSTVGILAGHSLGDEHASTVYQQIANGTSTLTRLAGCWIIAYAAGSILRIFQRPGDR
jgi:DNA-directed RNA polymerase subunit RPC12/RpoP